MPPLEETDLLDTIVVWPPVGNDNNGQPVVGSPQEKVARWVGADKEAISPERNEVGKDATVIVLERIANGSILWLGSLDDLPGTGTSPADAPTSDLFVVMGYNETKDIKNRFARRQLTVMRYNDRLRTSR